ncbi:MAG TPA: trypsin-like peptidase domain-containing protein, partial [Candidatus Methylomirabilis sp.]|nr:trypsin-like peptidase domain-containing protein [Candidatus Methylomirabilis sp.]
MWQTWRQWFAERKDATSLILVTLLMGGLLGAGVSGGLEHAAAAQAGGMTQARVTPPGSPQTFADLAEKLSPSVVNIRVVKVERLSGSWFVEPRGELGPGAPSGEPFERFFRGMPPAPHEFRQRGAGSGFTISQDGLIVTNNHVVEGAREVTVTLATKEEYPAKIVGRDPK